MGRDVPCRSSGPARRVDVSGATCTVKRRSAMVLSSSQEMLPQASACDESSDEAGDSRGRCARGTACLSFASRQSTHSDVGFGGARSRGARARVSRSLAPSTARVRSGIGRARGKSDGLSSIVAGDAAARFLGIAWPGPRTSGRRLESDGGARRHCGDPMSEERERSGCCCPIAEHISEVGRGLQVRFARLALRARASIARASLGCPFGAVPRRIVAMHRPIEESRRGRPLARGEGRHALQAPPRLPEHPDFCHDSNARTKSAFTITMRRLWVVLLPFCHGFIAPRAPSTCLSAMSASPPHQDGLPTPRAGASPAAALRSWAARRSRWAC